MIRALFVLFFAAGTLVAGEITLSKDSLKIYNNPVFSFTDEVTLSIDTPLTANVGLDSAFLQIDEMDTTGSTGSVSSDTFEIRWGAGLNSDILYFWRPDSRKDNTYRLMHTASTTSNKETIYFTASAPKQYIAGFEIGKCLGCSGVPTWYPPWFRGTLNLYFSNGQLISLRLYSYDLRKPVIKTGCQDYNCDSLSVRKILDKNGMESVPVEEVANAGNGRIYSLRFTYNPSGSVTLPKPITVLPEEIGNLTGLLSLSMVGNKIDSISPHIGRCCSLRTVHADGNRIAFLPDSFSHCGNLQYLSLENNELTHLPESFGNLGKIKMLHLRGNRLLSLPESMASLQKIECLFFSGNRICTLPEKVQTWVVRVQYQPICEMYEPAWPDSQDCAGMASALTEPGIRPACATIRSIIHEGTTVTVKLASETTGHTHLELFTITGRRVANFALSGTTVRLDTKHYPGGMYYLKVSSATGDRLIHPLIIE